MTNAPYDGQPLTVDEYLATPETTKRYELVYGVVREPAAPAWNHQTIVARLFGHLDRHVTRLEIGKVGLSPLDVVMDSHNHLVVQPDIVFVSTARTHIIRDRLWGAPDLVVEVLSPGTRRYDRDVKREWYERYGVLEQWVVDPAARTVEVANLSVLAPPPVEFDEHAIVRSRVLPRLRLRVGRVFTA
jgi:Uma2 family endonuclease